MAKRTAKKTSTCDPQEGN